MSLINRMLEDLEKRDPASTAGRGTLRRRNARELLPWLLVGILLVACGVLAWLALASDEPLTTSSTTLAVTPEVSAPVVAETQAVEAAPAETPAVSSTTETEQDETGQPAVVRAPAPTSAVAATTATRAASSSEPDAAPSTLSPAEPQPQESLPQDPEEPGTMQVAPAFVDPQAAAQQQIDTGLRALSRGQLDTATRNLRNGLAVLEDNDAAREALYVAYRRQGRLAEAEGVLRDGLAVASRPTTFAKLMARDLLARGDLQ
ncbi:MAG: hypothetical protein R3217_07725, partial [Gammaproteobacteria bacterium]|nr:hypothetical protein [Gammaproteobacteria bacterium]